jgi:predicted RNase H-like HicB family nuclease
MSEPRVVAYDPGDGKPEFAYKVVCDDCGLEWGWSRPSFVGGMTHYEALIAHHTHRVEVARDRIMSDHAIRTYEVTAKRDGKFWFVRIPEIDGATQGRTLKEVPEMARDYIRIVTGETEFDVRVRLIEGDASAVSHA